MRKPIVYVCLLYATIVVSEFLVIAAEPSDANWPRFRGPSGDGQVGQRELPVQWDDSKVQWVATLPAEGHSSPAVWGQHAFLTGSRQSGDAIERHVFCVDLESGQVLWDVAVADGAGEQIHKMNGWASPTCATDGQHVIAFFGPGGLHCLTAAGEKVWSRQLGEFPGVWGIGASPVIVGDLVIQNCDATGDSFLAAFNKADGTEVWRSERTATPRGGWSTPVLTPDGTLLLNGEFGITAYEPATGKSLWFCQGFNGRGTPAPVIGHDLIYVVNGKPGDVYAVRPGGSGDVTQSHMQWHTRRAGGRDLPSPILVGQTLVVVNMGGIATGYDAISGEERWQQRLGGNYAGSPIAVGARVYIVSETGNVAVFQIGDDCKVLSQNQLAREDDEIFRSSMSVAGQRLLVRSDKRLYCIGD